MIFQNWTKKNVHFGKSQGTFCKKNEKSDSEHYDAKKK
tara:strand:+ start:2320 stop:2433 length:114 start_codon:yes stop_codon:yes gene_type:complete